MTDLRWVRPPRGSWHIVVLDSDRVGRTRTLCGRVLGGMWTDRQPDHAETLGTGKSCESCLRLEARRVDAQVATERDG